MLIIFVDNKSLVNKISLIISSFISLLLAYLVAIIKGKNGLLIGLIIGITFSGISLGVHYFVAKEYFNSLYIRLIIFMISGCCGGVIGVNKKTD